MLKELKSTNVKLTFVLNQSSITDLNGSSFGNTGI